MRWPLIVLAAGFILGPIGGYLLGKEVGAQQERIRQRREWFERTGAQIVPQERHLRVVK